MNEDLAMKIVRRLFNSLEESTWSEKFPSAKEDLKQYTDDMIEDVTKVLDQYVRIGQEY